MKYFEIEISDTLTSFVFYNVILNELHYFLKKEHFGTTLVLNMSKCRKIDPLVIPNLLIVGCIIKEYTGVKPYIFIENTLETRSLKRYLYDINFVFLAKKSDIFEFDNSIEWGLAPRKMDELNATLFFSSEESEEETWERISKSMIEFSDKYLQDYKLQIGNYLTGNLILNLCREIIENAKKHGNSLSFLTFQYNYSDEKVKIAISDSGVGFLHTVNDGLNTGRIDYKISNFEIDNQAKAIFQGVFSRKNSELYGLYNTIRLTLESGGIVRIHSMDTQVIFTSKLLKYFQSNDLDINEFINQKSFEYNIRYDKKYAGVHIEYEIVLPKRKVKYINNGVRK